MMMIGRTGALTGNLLFPILLSVGCLPPFLMTGSIFLGKNARKYFRQYCKYIRFPFSLLRYILIFTKN